MIRALPLLILFLAACGSANPQAEATADRLENAAEQSDPASATRLEDAADAVRAGEGDASAAAPGSTAQDALEDAGNNSVAAPSQSGAMSAPPPKQAPVNRDGQVRPPPAVVPPNARN